MKEILQRVLPLKEMNAVPDVQDDVRTPADVQREMNDCPSLAAEDVQARSRYARPIRPPKRL